MNSSQGDPHQAKKAKHIDLEWTCKKWLADEALPPSLQSKEPDSKPMTQDQLRSLFDRHGLRTSVVRSPREALSIYKDSLIAVENNCSSDATSIYLVVMLGSHSCQEYLEQVYNSQWKSVHCLKCFCEKIGQVCTVDHESSESVKSLAKLLAETRDFCDSSILGKSCDDIELTCKKRLKMIRDATIAANSNWRSDQLQHEYDRIWALHASLGNALLQRFVTNHQLIVKDVYFKQSHSPQYERFSIYLYDSEIDELKPPPIVLLPCPRWDRGPEEIATRMVAAFWKQLLKRGYYASGNLRDEITPNLEKYFISGLSDNLNTPLLLTAHFTPQFPLSFYFYGRAGSGKSSLVRNFGPALNAVIEEFADPALLVRFVKQNLNKPLETLQLELDLRPNNNDMSVMSIIQSRRMTLKQSKPGLVVVALEEVASMEGNPDQLSTCQLLSQRFAGRKGSFSAGTSAPKNSAKRGISGDATIIALFTSNYRLETPCIEALQRLEMFRELQTVNVLAVSGKDRANFAQEYIQHQLIARHLVVDLTIPLDEGDTRPLVRHLRMLSYYINMLPPAETKVAVIQGPSTCRIEGSTSSVVELSVGTMGNIYPKDTNSSLAQDSVHSVMSQLSSKFSDDKILFELRFVLSFWLARTLAPAVVVSNDRKKVHAIFNAIKESIGIDDVHTLEGIDASAYKMMKSLYDPADARNLRDDILRFGPGASVVVELLCPSLDSQLCIREMIEDTPSQTAFSSEKSALFKSGILFLVAIDGKISPEVRSRASLIL